MEETTSYPAIEPSNFDLIVIGTGLPESILAAAASAAGKTVLHLDSNPFYGGHSASLPLTDFIAFLQSQTPDDGDGDGDGDDGDGDGDDDDDNNDDDDDDDDDDGDNYSSIPLLTRPLYSAVETNSYSSVEYSRRFNLDLAGPRVILCSDSMIDLILKTDINQYLEFKSVDASFMSDAEGKLETVPDSRSAIFKNRSLSLPEKNQLMKLFKLVQAHFGEEDRIPQPDLDCPFVEFLTKLGLSHKLKSIILHAIVLADYDQGNLQVCQDVINTKSGIERLALYHSSIGRFSNANGAIIYPIYGQGELPQSFCRRAAVKGCIYVLRMPIDSLLMDKDGRTYKGVKLGSGQELFSSHLILAPHFTTPSTLVPDEHAATSHNVRLSDRKEYVARGICLTKNPLNPEVANCLVFFPPKSLYPEQISTIRVLQLSSNVAVCPSGMFLTYLSATCDNAVEGKKLLNAAINALFSMPISGKSENCGTDNLSGHAEGKPCLLWSTLYIQELTKIGGAFHSISYTPMPDEHLHYNNLLDGVRKLFQEMYPNEEFFTVMSVSDDLLDEVVSEQDP